jgi:hypothetical protein
MTQRDRGDASAPESFINMVTIEAKATGDNFAG